MTLLDLPTIERAFARLYDEFEGGIPELDFKPSRRTEAEVLELEREVQAEFASSFRSMLLRYDLGGMNVGGVFIGHSDSYEDDLVWGNSCKHPVRWWDPGVRPDGLLMVAGSDGYVILMEGGTGAISAFRRDARWTSRLRIASNFEMLLRAAGTTYLTRKAAADKRTLGRDVGEACGADATSAFWQELALGFT